MTKLFRPSRETLDAVIDGTRVRITWSGGNGPHEYTLHWDDGILMVCLDSYEVEAIHWLGCESNYPLFELFEFI